MKVYTININTPSSLFDMEKFKEIYGRHFNFNMLVLEAKDNEWWHEINENFHVD